VTINTSFKKAINNTERELNAFFYF
jgi:hypothetical protein